MSNDITKQEQENHKRYIYWIILYVVAYTAIFREWIKMPTG